LDTNGVTETAAEVRGLCVAFGGRKALREVDCDLPSRSITVVIGRSGSGKTTLLRALNRLNECFPGCETRGEVRLRLRNGWVSAYAPDAPPLEELRRSVGMVFQTPNVLPMSVERNVLLPIRLVTDLPRREQMDLVEKSIREAQLWDEVKDRLGADALGLSVGQQQRLCLARALALAPDMLLLDEPTASVDYAAAGRIEELLQRLRERYTIVMVSHSLSQARRLADRLLVMRDGVLVRSLGRDEILREERLERSVDDLF
jgi:phosphate transport system ATP-binding protein